MSQPLSDKRTSERSRRWGGLIFCTFLFLLLCSMYTPELTPVSILQLVLAVAVLAAGIYEFIRREAPSDAVKRRTFFLPSILLVLVALGFHSAARDQILQGSRRRAQSIEAAIKQQIRAAPDVEAARLSNNVHALNKIGLVFAFSCVVCLAVAFVRRESGWYSIPIMLLFADLMVQMLL